MVVAPRTNPVSSMKAIVTAITNVLEFWHVWKTNVLGSEKTGILQTIVVDMSSRWKTAFDAVRSCWLAEMFNKIESRHFTTQKCTLRHFPSIILKLSKIFF